MLAFAVSGAEEGSLGFLGDPAAAMYSLSQAASS